jgi:cytochrome o ubiquinol oxidase subunit 3
MNAHHDPLSTQETDPHDNYGKTVFGFWLFLLNDFIFFGTLFATFVVLGKNPYWAKLPMRLFDIDYATAQSFLSLFSAFMAGLGSVAAHRENKKATLGYFSAAFVFLACFMALEYLDFKRLIDAGYSWDKTGLLSAFYSLLGTHGLHVLLAMVWIPVLLVPVYKEGITEKSLTRLACLKMLIQFLNIIWIFIYTIVYFMGSLLYD